MEEENVPAETPEETSEESKKKFLFLLLFCCFALLALLGTAAIAYFLLTGAENNEPILRFRSVFNKFEIPDIDVPVKAEEEVTTAISATITTTVHGEKFMLVAEKKNFTDAIAFCRDILEASLWIPESVDDEETFLDWASDNNISAHCNQTFVGLRYRIDKQWHPIDEPEGPYSFGHISGNLFDCPLYDWGSEHCLGILIKGKCNPGFNNIPCDSPSDCYACQTKQDCFTTDCIEVFTKSRTTHFSAKNNCRSEGYTFLRLHNQNEANKVVETLKKNPHSELCDELLVDMTTSPFYESYKEEDVQFKLLSLDFNESGDVKIKEMCVTYEDSEWGSRLMRENCSNTHCFVCTNR